MLLAASLESSWCTSPLSCNYFAFEKEFVFKLSFANTMYFSQNNITISMRNKFRSGWLVHLHRPLHFFLMQNVRFCLKFVRFDPVGIGRVMISYLGSFLCRLFLVFIIVYRHWVRGKGFWIVLSRRSTDSDMVGPSYFLMCLSVCLLFSTLWLLFYITRGSEIFSGC